MVNMTNRTYITMRFSPLKFLFTHVSVFLLVNYFISNTLPYYRLKHSNEYFSLYFWSGWRESNPRRKLGRLLLYHWATPAQFFFNRLLSPPMVQNGGGSWIRTNVDVRQRVYSPSPLATRAPLHLVSELLKTTLRSYQFSSEQSSHGKEDVLSWIFSQLSTQIT